MQIVVNESLVVFVGEPVRVREDIQVTFDCIDLIQKARNEGISNPDITWYKNGIPLSNGSAVNVVISPDTRFCIITNTIVAMGGQIGTYGNYTCRVCHPGSFNCNSTSSKKSVCGKTFYYLCIILISTLF